MLRTIQIIALLQGLFLLTILIKNKKKYLKPAFLLLVGSIISILFYILGDDDNNLFFENVDLFYFDKYLFITFLFLFIKYQVSGLNYFSKFDFFYFTPNILYATIELLENSATKEIPALDFFEIVLELIFLGYLCFTLYAILTSQKQKWILLFLVPLVALLCFEVINQVLVWFGWGEIPPSGDEYFGSYVIIIVAFLFYGLAFKLMLTPKEVLSYDNMQKYKSSTLKQQQITEYKALLIQLMEKEEIYRDPHLSIQKIAEKMEIPRQYVSEVINHHMETNFNDFVNSYRVEAFIKLLNNVQYNHFTLFGIAKEVGFNSKSAFNSTFKKIKGLTPSEFRKRNS